jgi:aconitate hydratase
VTVKDIANFAPNQPLTVVLTHQDGSTDEIKGDHTFNSDQIEWFKAGSALNKLRADLD